jgi:hypothetical protein
MSPTFSTATSLTLDATSPIQPSNGLPRTFSGPSSRASSPGGAALDASVLTSLEPYFTPGGSVSSSDQGTPSVGLSPARSPQVLARSPVVVATNASPRDGAMSPFSEMLSPDFDTRELEEHLSDEDIFAVSSPVVTASDVGSDEFEQLSEASSWADAASH